jgi:hypothetical protein
MTEPSAPPVSERERIAAAKEEVFRLCREGNWRMSIPVNEQRDSDRIIMNGLDAAATLVAARAQALREFVEEIAGGDCHRYTKHLGAVPCGSCETCRARFLLAPPAPARDAEAR